MLKTYEGIYRNGKVELLEPANGPEGGHAYVTFLTEQPVKLPFILADAPLDDEPETEEEAAAVSHSYGDVKQGRLIAHEEIRKETDV
ncbi:MAG: hypothetical protein GW893_22100 [Armatimonadetes bacterium]|nr:hypothetical protein [Armatimonadota bacterium]